MENNQFTIDPKALAFKRNQPAAQQDADTDAGNMKKANFDIPEDLFYRFKLLTVGKHVTMREAFMEAIKDYLSKHEGESNG